MKDVERLVADIRVDHTPELTPEGRVCEHCEQWWPCPAVQAADAVDALQKERDHWKANHDNMTAQNELLRTRLDLDANDPATQAAQRFRIIAERDALQQRVGELEKERGDLLDVARAAMLWQSYFAKRWEGCEVEGEPVMMGQPAERNLFDAVVGLRNCKAIKR